MQEDQRFNELAEKWLNGTITDVEKEEFNQWYNRTGDDTIISIPQSFARNKEELKERIFQHLPIKQKARLISLNAKKSWLAVASLILVIGLSFVFWQSLQRGTESIKSEVIARNEPTIHAGGNMALLTLSDGTVIVLDTLQKGVISQETASHVVKLEDGQVQYRPSSTTSADISFNTLNTPVGGQYSVVLSDGTRVWLNSSSSLRFPTSFIGKERVVELKGEGYFEVAKNTSMPFKVKIGETEVDVLGTHFNVMAYDDETEIQTTLLEGAVRVREKGQQVAIIPGQQVSSDKQGVLRVRKSVNTELIVAWKNGLFQFEKTELSSILRQIGRWYNVKITNPDGVKGHFSGTISKTASIEKVLRSLELTGAVHFTIKGREVFVGH